MPKFKIGLYSNGEFYEKERSGIKNNTLRELKDDADQKTVSSFESSFLKGEIPLIKIYNKRTGESFERELKDISVYEGFVVFTWK